MQNGLMANQSELQLEAQLVKGHGVLSVVIVLFTGGLQPILQRCECDAASQWQHHHALQP